VVYKEEMNMTQKDVIVVIEAQQHKEVFCHCRTMEEAIDICKMYDWEFTDENGFVWSMGIED
jgi:hypothetical protein